MKYFPFSHFIVHGNSMFPTLKPGQSAVSLNWFFRIKKGDLVVIKRGGKHMIKRIQKIDGRHIFVTGDNQKESTDSRSFGWVDKSQIVGKVILSYN